MAVKSGHIMCQIPVKIVDVRTFSDGTFVTLDILDGQSCVTMRVGETFDINYKLDVNYTTEHNPLGGAARGVGRCVCAAGPGTNLACQVHP